MRLVVSVLIALAAGALTSFGQTWLPDPVNSLANSSGSWCAVALAVGLLVRSRVLTVASGPLALLALLAGYEVTSVLRGYAVAASTVAEWVAAAVVVGPFLGVGAWGLTARRPLPAVVGVAVLAGVLVGEGVYGLTVIDDSTSPVYWTISVVAGVLVPLSLRWAGARTLAAAYGLTAVVALAFWVAYQSL